MFELFSLLVAILALVVARKSFNQAAALRARLDAIEAAGMATRPGPPRSRATAVREYPGGLIAKIAANTQRSPRRTSIRRGD